MWTRGDMALSDSCPKQSFETEMVLFGFKPPFLRGVERYVLGVKCHSCGCNFSLEWFIWINGSKEACQTSTFGDGSYDRYSMDPKKSLERVFFSLKSPFCWGLSSMCLASNVTHVAAISRWNGSYGSMGPKGHVRRLHLVMGALPGAQWVRNNRLRGSFLA